MMTFYKAIIHEGARINGLERKLLICDESEKDTFRFPLSKKP